MFDRLIAGVKFRATTKRYLQKQLDEWRLAHGRWSKQKRQFMDALTALQEDRAKIRGRLTDVEDAAWRVLDADSVYGEMLHTGSHDDLKNAQRHVWIAISALRRLLSDG